MKIFGWLAIGRFLTIVFPGVVGDGRTGDDVLTDVVAAAVLVGGSGPLSWRFRLRGTMGRLPRGSSEEFSFFVGVVG